MNRKKALLALIAVAVVGIVLFFRLMGQFEQREQGASEMPVSPPLISRDAVAQEEGVVPQLKTGETKISIRTNYENPGGFDDIGFNLVIDNEGIITDASVDVLAKSEMAKKRQQAFAEEFSRILKGKKLQELEELDFIGGSSLTTRAFNESLEKLKSRL